MTCFLPAPLFLLPLFPDTTKYRPLYYHTLPTLKFNHLSDPKQCGEIAMIWDYDIMSKSKFLSLSTLYWCILSQSQKINSWTSWICQTHFSTILENRLMHGMGISDLRGWYIPSAATVHMTRIPPLEQGLMSYQNYSLLLTIRSLCCGNISEAVLLGEYVTLATLGYIPKTQNSHPKTLYDTFLQCTIGTLSLWVCLEAFTEKSCRGGIWWTLPVKQTQASYVFLHRNMNKINRIRTFLLLL